MKARILSLIMVLLTFFCSVGCNYKAPDDNSGGGKTDVSDATTQNQLQILKSDFKISAEETALRIKSEYLLKNDGYKDDDEIVVTLTLDGDSLTDLYLSDYSDKYQSVSEFLSTSYAKKAAADIEKKQNALIKELNAKGLIEEVDCTYDVLLNGVAVKIKYGNLKAIEKLASVSSTIVSDTYSLPKTTTGTDVSAIENAVDIYDTGIFKPVGVDYTGKKTSVAVLDSGFDCSHSVFNQNIPSSSDVSYSSSDISKILESNKLNATKITSGLDLGDVYYSRKIPFVYDYADKDPDVFPYDSEHGTHVAGIIGGQDDRITGIAKDTQLVLMKVFADLDSGADTQDILSALEDAVVLGVDAINMSLGSSCGFSREVDNDRLNKVYDAINDAGISLVTAASNDYSSAYGGEEGNTNKVTNPDSATVGSPSTYPAALSVASISGTKSKYMVANGEQVVFFTESNSINGKENDFYKELGIGLSDGLTESKTYDYVTVPGNGLKVNYSSVDVKGKIALVRRGDNTFEEKAQLAKANGAVACIIYNNVEGDIIMSMGKTDHIPTISVSKEDGAKLAAKKSGTLILNANNQAGPFMSDFSSWGPTSDLKIKPEITAHGGNILSAVPGGKYDTQSGTSMASPNMCGAVVLLRQHVKEKYPELNAKEVTVLTNQLLMSTATIVLNSEGNPYSPRKQGAGLASLKGAVSTPAYITIDGSDRTKLELGDDPKRTGVYVMEFNVKNDSASSVTYDIATVAMTESVSSSDKDFVAEKAYMLSGSDVITVSGGTLDGKKITVSAGSVAKVKVTYTMDKKDKNYIDESFPYGSFVEGFVKLTADAQEGVNLNVPFLSFYGDWTEAPLFDKTYYEVESEAHNGAIDEEDKLKADYFATTPYGSYYYNYIIPLGTYLYDIDENAYDAIPASEDHISMSNALGTIDGLSCVYAGLLRNAKKVYYTITDKVTGEIVWSYVDYNANKAHYYNGIQFPYYDNLRLKSYPLGLVNNRQYEFSMNALLDYGDGGVTTNVRNSFGFDFYLDDEAPIIKEVTYEKEYDKSLKKDRYYINMTVYDNHYAMSVAPIIFTSSSSYTFLTENPIPLYGERGEDVKVRFEITDFLQDISFDELITSGLAFTVDDYALNSNLYICQLPGTKGEFSFTSNGQVGSPAKINITAYEGEVIDLTRYLATADATDENKEYLKYLLWESSNSDVASVSEGLVKCLKAGDTVITVTEQMDLKNASIIIKVKKKTSSYEGKDHVVTDAEDATVKSIRFSHFETLFAYSRAAQYSQIGSTGDVKFLSAMNGINFYPGEKIKLYHDFDPWYAEGNYELSYNSTNPSVASVNEEGEVTALKEGSTIIQLKIKGSYLIASVNVTVNNEFIIENRQLIAYKGLGGEVVIPDDEGILYISAYAFCLYETDQTMELPDDDYDANKIPSMNTTITKVVIPEGVEDIQKYAFYNCVGLKEVVIPDSVKYIREYAFYKTALTSIDVKNAMVIGHHCFAECSELKSISMSEIYAVGPRAFENCKKLEFADLTSLRNTGREAFKGCEALASVVLGEHTKLSYGMFAQSGLKTVDIYEKEAIPAYCFAQCKQLERVTFHNDLTTIGEGAFCQNPELTEVTLKKVSYIGEQAFYDCEGLKTFSLPDCEVTLGNYSFFDCAALEKINFAASTKITKIEGSIFQGTALSTFTVNDENNYYSVSTDGTLLLNRGGNEIIFAAVTLTGDYVLDEKYDTIGDGAFAGTLISSLTINNPALTIGDYAFANAENLASVTFPTEGCVSVGAHAFRYASSLSTVTNLDKLTDVKDYAFANGGLISATVAANATYGEGVFFTSKLKEITIGANTTFGLGSFQYCYDLTTVNIADGGNVHFGRGAFGNCTALTDIDLSKIDGVIERETFYGCKNLKTANMPQVTEIGAYAFADCALLSGVNMPNVTKIGEGAFGRYDENGSAPSISKVTLPETLTELGDGVFVYCLDLTEVIIKAELTAVPDYTFAFCSNLEKVVLPETVTSVGEYAFATCEGLTSINLGKVEYFKDYAFARSTYLANVDLSSAKEIGYYAFGATAISGAVTANNLTSVGEYAFQNAYITSFTAPELAVIKEGAFYGNNMEEFVISSKLSEIGPMAFVDCYELTTFKFNGKDGLTDNGVINDYAKLDQGSLYVKTENGAWLLTSVPSSLDVETFTVADGTTRIEVYAANENKKFSKVVLPDGLKLIGNYAFYGCDNLKTVEFRSVIAPALEDAYSSDLALSDTAPGYEKLHPYVDLFGLELYYCNFIDFLGNKEPISMIVPANADIKGYDSVVYEVYFGKLSEAEVSDYVAMETNLSLFIEYANKILKIENVTLSHETLINNALTAYNAITQDAIAYGVQKADWDNMVEKVTAAKKELVAIKLSKATVEVRNVQAVIDALNDTFSVSDIPALSTAAEKINSLTPDDKAILDLTAYNRLITEYNAYLASVETEVQPIVSATSSVTYGGALAAATAVLGALATVFAILKKRFI